MARLLMRRAAGQAHAVHATVASPMPCPHRSKRLIFNVFRNLRRRAARQKPAARGKICRAKPVCGWLRSPHGAFSSEAGTGSREENAANQKIRSPALIPPKPGFRVRRNQGAAMRFEGTKNYVADNDLKIAVNAAIALERPLLIKGEPGTGKTVLAAEVAKAIGAPLIEWHVKSTTKALQGLYEYDAVSRLRDSQLGDPRVSDIKNYIRRGKLWEAFVSAKRPVLLIDEIDKADIEFPNDLLLELDRMEFHVYETGETIKAAKRPLVVITSNNEKELPDAFLRRCFFHYIRFPDEETMKAIVEVHFPGIKKRLVSEALTMFYEIRDVPGLKKKPSTSELLDWLKLLMVEDVSPELLRERDAKKLIPPLHGALLKNEQDVHLFERLAFLSRREGGR
jgi:MoxR-like ATPase